MMLAASVLVSDSTVGLYRHAIITCLLQISRERKQSYIGDLWTLTRITSYAIILAPNYFLVHQVYSTLIHNEVKGGERQH